MKIGITGANGFVGWHLRCYLSTVNRVTEVRLADRMSFNDPELLRQFVAGLDLVFHLAGINRASDEELVEGNQLLAKKLVSALKDTNPQAFVIYSSSTHALKSPIEPYGKGKALAKKVLSKWAESTGAKFLTMIIPHVFGEYGTPYYNSGVATFCHQILHEKELEVNQDGTFELLHVQDLVEKMFDLAVCEVVGQKRIIGKVISVPEVVSLLKSFRNTYIVDNQLPDLSDSFVRDLFNTFRGAIPHKDRLVFVGRHSDERGWLVETIKANSGGQSFVSTTKAGITRGNHFHRRKVERFFVLSGEARVTLRKLHTNEVITYDLCGNKASFVDIPTLHTHAITNIGSKELVTQFWTNEHYNPEEPDTFFEEVDNV